jgi:hypothetical protein
MARGRTPEISNLETRASRLVNSIAKHERLISEQTEELHRVNEALELFNSPEFLDQKKALVERKKAELEKLLANIAKMESLSD